MVQQRAIIEDFRMGGIARARRSERCYCTQLSVMALVTKEAEGKMNYYKHLIEIHRLQWYLVTNM